MKLNIAVFFGGMSCEHEISCISANQALKALDSTKYEVIPIYVSKDNDLYTGSELLELKNYYDLDKLCKSLTKVCLYKDGNKVYMKPIKGLLAKATTIDVAFLVMHGTGGEDGSLQGMMEMLDLPYTSSNVLGSAVGQDKVIMKEILEYEKIPMVPWFFVYSNDIKDTYNDIEIKAGEIGYPLIIKPANLGSSIGIEVVHKKEELLDALNECAKYDDKLVIEKMVKQLKEVNISVFGNANDAKVSAIEEVLKGDEFLSFNNKYLGGAKGKCGSKSVKLVPTKGSKGMASTSRIVPAKLDTNQKEQIEEYALKSFKALNASGVVRIDFMIDKEDGTVYVNEINSIPGSLAFYLWKAVGVDFGLECDMLIDNALNVYREKKKKVRSFDTNILSNYKEK